MIRGLIEDFYDVQRLRIDIENQLRAIEQGKTSAIVFEEKWLRQNVFERVSLIEKDIYKKIAEWVEDEPIYRDWLKDVKGIGPILGAGLIGWIGDVKRFATISKLWMYTGLGVDEEGRAIKRKRGSSLRFNPRLKMHAWKIGEAFVKGGDGYRELYEQFREEYDRKWLTPKECGSKGCENKGKGKCMKGHRYAAAKRKTVKVFLAHLWMKWRELEKLPIEHPFIIGKAGHKHLIEPCES